METRSRAHSGPFLLDEHRTEVKEECEALIREFNSIVENSAVEDHLRNLEKRRLAERVETAAHEYEKQDEEQKRLHELWSRITEINCAAGNELKEAGLLHSSDESDEAEDG